jgi:predicted N-acyltransferase
MIFCALPGMSPYAVVQLGNTDFEWHVEVEPRKKHVKKDSNDYVIRVLDSPLKVNAAEWNALLAAQNPGEAVNPFMRHEYLAALHESGSATPKPAGPALCHAVERRQLAGACALYFKDHSYGEYVFDWAWANAYEQHGLRYYPKAVTAVPFTPVPGRACWHATAPSAQRCW